MSNEYHHQTQLARARRLRELQKELPPICSDYLLAIEQQTSPLTRLSYAYDLKLFFQYLSDELPRFSGKPIVDFSVEDIRQITKQDLERYARYLALYVKNESLEDGEIAYREISNNEYGIKRKYASLRAFYKYLFSDGMNVPLSVWTSTKWPEFWTSQKAGKRCQRPIRSITTSPKSAIWPCFLCSWAQVSESVNAWA